MKKKLLYSLVLFFSFYVSFSKSYEKKETLTCPDPTLNSASAITFNSVTLNWVENGTATLWNVLVLPAGVPAPLPSTTGWLVSSVNPFVVTGLNPNTTYDFYVRSDCGGEYSNWSNLVSATTLSAPPVCGGNYVDSGGVSANYANNSDTTTTICPSNPGDAVVVTFVSFNTQASHDALYVYDGNSVTSPQISSSNPAGSVPGGQPGGYWGTTVPGSFTSSSSDGCLTFRFRSDATINAAGWVANVTCNPIPCEVPTGLAVSNVSDTVAILTWNSTPFSSGALITLTSDTGVTYTVFSGPGIVTMTLQPDHCYTASVSSYCSGGYSEPSAPISFCMVDCEDNAECAESLILNAFLDSNNNGIKDTGEVDFNHGNFVYQLNDSGSNQYGYSNDGSYFIFDSNPTNSYDISFDINADFSTYYTSAVSHNDITIPTGSGATYLYFPIVNVLPHVDAQVTLCPSGQPRPGFSYGNVIYYQNNGSQTIPNGTITFTKDPNLSITSISQTGTTATATGFTYDFTNLGPFESRYLLVNFAVPTIPTVNLGDLLTNNVTVQIANDINLANNSSSVTQTIVGSYDPNDKMESHGGKIVHSAFTSNDYLYYTIQFENTGSADAEFVKVQDALDYQLDENTFEMLGASHNVDTKRVGTQLTWHFYNINLPPTSLNPSESHGFVYFRIKPKAGYAIGDMIPNRASIYFDYNPPIVTNQFETEFVLTLGNPTFNTNTISLYPNPTTDMVAISNSAANDKIATVVIYEVSGKRVYTLNKNTLRDINVDVSNFARGLYLVELTSENNTKVTKKLLLK
ncbi:DUF7619 domain-containing protein [Flavobacterium sangjuense]|uniref:Fibronectin type-III domain-containing protein n=1 Tax=Flavobacterium sangjuense TaxID=2518177 RepID=A0A4P7PRK3_9FLAO|nr:T9SS type A sorting domain-containing protein [Flavobacterium sangjuense]QBZ97459.1 hypothetical protein GS03_00950 [Flavobacterium sangjuense]